METNTSQSNNPLIRFLDDSVIETIQGLRDAAKSNQEEIDKMKKTLLDAQIRISELLQNL